MRAIVIYDPSPVSPLGEKLMPTFKIKCPCYGKLPQLSPHPSQMGRVGG